MDTYKIKDYQKFFENLCKPSTSQQQPQKPSKKQQQQRQPQPQQSNTKKKKKKNKQKKKYEKDPNFEQKVESKVTELYGYGIDFQQQGRYKRAYLCFRALSKIVSTEPTVWLRMAECVLGHLDTPLTVAKQELYVEEVKAGQPLDMIAVGPFKGVNDEESEEFKDKIAPEELTYRYADICMMTCRTLLRDMDNEPLKRWANAIHAFIHMQRNNSRIGLRLYKQAITPSSTFNPETLPHYLKHYTMISMVQYLIRKGKVRHGLYLTSKMEEVPIGPARSDTTHSIVFNEAFAWFTRGKYQEAAQLAEMLLETDDFTEALALAAEIYKAAGKKDEYQEVFDRLAYRAQIGDGKKMANSQAQDVYVGLTLEEEYNGFNNPVNPQKFGYNSPFPKSGVYKPNPEQLKKFFAAEEANYEKLGAFVEKARKTFQMLMAVPGPIPPEILNTIDQDVEDKDTNEVEGEDFEMDKPSTSKG